MSVQRCCSTSFAARRVAAFVSTSPGVSFASSVRRAAPLTASPMTVYSKRSEPPMCPATTWPEATPMPALSSWPDSSSWSSRAPWRACEAASWSETGAPNTESAASPWNLLITPLLRCTTSTTTSKNSLSAATTSSGVWSTAYVVEPMTSMNNTATLRSSPPSSGRSSSAFCATSAPTYWLKTSRTRCRSRRPRIISLKPAWSTPISEPS